MKVPAGRRHAALVAAALALAASTRAPFAQQPTTVLPTVQVFGPSPLIGSGIDRNAVPAATHVLDSKDLQREGMPDLMRTLNQQIGGATIDSASGNPFQPTFYYRGFAASPLQGTPQGLAVY